MTIMIQYKHIFNHTKNLVIPVIYLLLAACSTGTESANTSTDSASPDTSSVASSSPQPPSSTITIPGVNSVNEINFKSASNNSFGFFDTINGSTSTRSEVPKAGNINASGWAVLVDKGRPADSVIITSGDANSLVAVAPVNLKRPDVVKALKNSAYENSGWIATFNSSTLPAQPVVLKAWAYNSATKEATQLTPTHEVVVSE